MTEQILSAMLALEVEDIHHESNLLKNGVVLDNFFNRAVVIEEYMFWHGAGSR